MKKISKLVKPMLGAGMLFGVYYFTKKSKKNMLDVLIDEIQTMK